MEGRNSRHRRYEERTCNHFLKIAKELVNDGKNHWGIIFVEMNKLSVGECIKRIPYE